MSGIFEVFAAPRPGTLRVMRVMRVNADTAEDHELVAAHLRQLESVHAAFTPPAAVTQARRAVEAFEADGTGAAVVDGRLIDKPVVDRARATLARALASNEEESV